MTDPLFEKSNLVSRRTNLTGPKIRNRILVSVTNFLIVVTKVTNQKIDRPMNSQFKMRLREVFHVRAS